MKSLIKILTLIFIFTSSLFALEPDENYTLTVKRNGVLFNVPFIENGEVNQKGYEKLCYIFADVKDRKAVLMDPNLFYILAKTQYYLYYNYNIRNAITVDSGYRTWRTNSNIEGAGKNSMHIQGKAVDVKIEGVSMLTLAKVLRHFGGKGIGVYDKHVHLDTWKLRAWKGISH
jgi:uncharacterized protein YcbK (DUF882 family)